MATLCPGQYKISNGAQGPGGTTLYLTFPGSNTPAIVKPDASWTSQLWVVEGNSGLQSIVPATTGFQMNAAVAGQYVEGTTDSCQWNINYDTVKRLYTIQTSGAALNWSLAGTASAGQSVILASPTGNMPQYWKFTRVADPSDVGDVGAGDVGHVDHVDTGSGDVGSAGKKKGNADPEDAESDVQISCRIRCPIM